MLRNKQEFCRKFVHLSFGICLTLVVFMFDRTLLLLLFSLGIAIYFPIIKFFSKLPASLQKFILYLSREDELSFMIGKGSFFFILAIVICLILFTKVATAVATLIAAVGDAFSTIIGKSYGTQKLRYNKDKSLEGSLAFFTSSITATCLFKFSANLDLEVIHLLVTVFICTLLESFVRRNRIFDDNFVVIIAGALLIYLFQ